MDNQPELTFEHLDGHIHELQTTVKGVSESQQRLHGRMDGIDLQLSSLVANQTTTAERLAIVEHAKKSGAKHGAAWGTVVGVIAAVLQQVLTK